MQRGFGYQNRRNAGFNPATLFTGGIQGAWYDPSDLTTLFQDSAGTTPVTTVEQPVGLMLDKSGRGNHAYQTTSASRPTLRARYNLLTRSEEFGDAYWARFSTSITTNAAIAPDGTTTADLLVPVTTGIDRWIYRGGFDSSVKTYSVYAKASGMSWMNLANSSGAGGGGVWFDLTNGVLGTVSAGFTASITSVGDGWYRCSTTQSGSNGANFIIGVCDSDNTRTATASGSNGILIWGAQLVPTAVFPTNVYQRVGAATDYATGAAFPPYLAFDGVDDSMLTNSVDFSGTDKMLVVAGVTKQSDAAAGIVAELSANGDSNNGAFYVSAAAGAASNYATAMRGTSLGYYLPATFAAPIANVVSMIGDIAQSTLATEIVPRINGTVVQTGGVGGSGTGNFGNYPLYIGRRNNATLPFNGSLFSLIIAGQSYAAGQITSTEQWVAARTPLGSI